MSTNFCKESFEEALCKTDVDDVEHALDDASWLCNISADAVHRTPHIIKTTIVLNPQMKETILSNVHLKSENRKI